MGKAWEGVGRCQTGPTGPVGVCSSLAKIGLENVNEGRERYMQGSGRGSMSHRPCFEWGFMVDPRMGWEWIWIWIKKTLNPGTKSKVTATGTETGSS
jgi:hypothetical protein